MTWLLCSAETETAGDLNTELAMRTAGLCMIAWVCLLRDQGLSIDIVLFNAVKQFVSMWKSPELPKLPPC